VRGIEEHRGLWGRAFRPFFLIMSMYAALAVPLWAATWLGILPATVWLTPSWWHGHEMIFGFVASAIAGFLLTASPVWTGGRALSGPALFALVILWLAGRLAMIFAGPLPNGLVAAIDLAFLPAVGLAVLHTLWGSGQTRNYAVVGILFVLTFANAAMHAEAIRLADGLAGSALRFAVDGVIVLILVIGGRITPAFTQNAFRRDGIEASVRTSPWVSGIAIATAIAVAIVRLVHGHGIPTGLLSMLAACAVGLRLLGWKTWLTRSDPLLWSLHAGSIWVVIGLFLTGAGEVGLPIPPGSGVHALTAGAIGATIIAVITRVGLGHTGRALSLPAGVVWCYVLVNLGAVARVVTPFLGGDTYRTWLIASAVVWGGGFGLFAIRYWRILLDPRPDGKPG
jgi:uncharacterized protein involved in response to NO